MNNTKNQTQSNQLNLAEQVMDEIQANHVKMRPKLHFWLGYFLFVLGISIIFGFSIFLINLISFRLRADLPFDYLIFGTNGIRPFLMTFPWIFVIIAVVLMAIGFKLLKKFDFSYKHNFFLIVTAIAISIFTAGFITDYTGINEPLRSVHPLKELYSPRFNLTENNHHWMIGQVEKTDQNTIQIITPHGEVLTVSMENAEMLPHGKHVAPGEYIRVVGNINGNDFEAIGFSRFTPRVHFEITPPAVRGMQHQMHKW